MGMVVTIINAMRLIIVIVCFRHNKFLNLRSDGQSPPEQCIIQQARAERRVTFQPMNDVRRVLARTIYVAQA